MYTRSTTVAEARADRSWWLLDLEGLTLGRAATRIAHILRGKHKPTFTPHVDCGDFVVIINAGNFALTGAKMKQKTYFHHTGYVGGIKSITVDKLLERDAERVIRKAVKGMLPSGVLGRAMLRKLKIYTGSEHPHSAQQPQELTL